VIYACLQHQLADAARLVEAYIIALHGTTDDADITPAA